MSKSTHAHSLDSGTTARTLSAFGQAKLLFFILFCCVGCSTSMDTQFAADAAANSTEARSVPGASFSNAPLFFPQDFMLSVKSYGAVGDGITDDTSAIQRALADGRSNTSADYYGKPKALFFPQGTYLVHDTLQWIGCCVTLQGTGPTSSVIRLAPHASGFADSLTPKPLILTPKGNTSFRQNLWDIGLSIGPGNPGVTAASYVSNNVGSVHNVLITSEDGKGHAGIDLTRQWVGPLMVRNTEVVGFDVGIDLQNAEYGVTFEGITVRNQNITGIRNINQPISVRGLVSVNTVPALTNAGGMVVLIDASLTGGILGTPALVTNSPMYLRNILSSAYGATLQDTSSGTAKLTQGPIPELLAGASKSLANVSASSSLNLPIEETPSYIDSDMSHWGAFLPRWYGDTAGLQTLLDGGQSTIYFPFKAYFSSNEVDVIVPDSVQRIVGFSSVVNGNSSGAGGGGIRFVVTSNTTRPLIIEQFGYGVKIEQRGNRPIVVKDTRLNDYVSYPGAGKLYLEDVGLQGLSIQQGQQVWARQLNDEWAGTKVTNSGAAWILGLKTERAGMIIDTAPGGKTELLGGLIYPAMAVPLSDVAFRSRDAQVSYIYKESVYCKGCGYTNQVQDEHAGQIVQITSPSNNHFQCPLYSGKN